MTKITPKWKMSACLAAAALTWLGSMTAGQAALTGSLTLRPLTPTEIKSYSLTNPPAQFSAGLTTVGLGEPAYLEALVNVASNNTSVVWTLTSKPSGSAATLLASPLGTNVPVYKSADKKIYRTADRALLRPDVVGPYTVNAAITTVGSGSTNVSITIVGATYLGLQTCASCHSGAFANVPDKYSTYTNTAHASFFSRAIDGVESDHYGKSCISCHVVGYDTNSFAVNGGFDDMATLLGWTFPTVLTNGNWAAMPSQLQNLANIQCENCHGPGSQHIFSQGITGNTNAISVTFAAADCSQCHDSLNNHYRSAEWNVSGHANSTRTPSGPTRAACARCHTASGFAAYTDTLSSTNVWTGTNVAYTTYEAITCQTCHDPHDASNPHQLRTAPVVTLADGETVATITNAGAGSLCMNCHQSRSGSYTNSLVGYPLGRPTYAGGSSSFGPHDNPAADMLEGVNGYTYGKVIPSSAHRGAVTDTCAGCHMQAVATTDPAFLQAGDHTFSMTYTNSSGATVDKVDACVQCHGSITSFDMVKVDYNGDGVIEGVQTEVQHLLDKLSMLFPPKAYQANPANYVADGLVKSPSTQTNWPAKFLQAAWNWQFVNNDLSKGVHNAAYATGLLKASIGDLTGDNNQDGLPDSWQIAYFGAGFATNPAAGPNAVNNTGGVANWMMCALNSNPFGTLTVDGSGAIYVHNGNVENGDTNTIAIYTAAEIAFNTVSGAKYKIQGISNLNWAGTAMNWTDVSTNVIVGTGSTASYLTPTRGNQQMFYRVVQMP